MCRPAGERLGRWRHGPAACERCGRARARQRRARRRCVRGVAAQWLPRRGAAAARRGRAPAGWARAGPPARANLTPRRLGLPAQAAAAALRLLHDCDRDEQAARDDTIAALERRLHSLEDLRLRATLAVGTATISAKHACGGNGHAQMLSARRPARCSPTCARSRARGQRWATTAAAPIDCAEVDAAGPGAAPKRGARGDRARCTRYDPAFLGEPRQPGGAYGAAARHLCARPRGRDAARL